MGNKDILAIIPARGGSKSVLKKNIHLLAGKPLIVYTIEAAKRSALLTRTIVSTDDEEIARIARDLGAEVPFMRPAEHASDQAEDLPVFKHALQWFNKHERWVPEIVCRLAPTSPLRRAEHIDAACRLLLGSPQADSVRSVCEAPKHPLKMWRIKNGDLAPFVPLEVFGIREPYNKPRQALPEAYVQNGVVEAIRSKTILEKNSMSGEKILSLVVAPEDSVNIDGPLDFLWAEFLISQRKGSVK
ncbi:MAG: acylneuraminate cytidylyltransferase family protein [Elusimicrobia bacterium]|nr:acylneuraminate cytidylyltransferase family protein [Elusimicrobiota bacterium]